MKFIILIACGHIFGEGGSNRKIYNPGLPPEIYIFFCHKKIQKTLQHKNNFFFAKLQFLKIACFRDHSLECIPEKI